MLDLTKELEAAQDELSSERAQHVSLQRTTDSAIQAMRDEIELFKVEQSRGKAHQDILERTVDEQRSEMVELRLAMSALELQKESLLFQSSTNEGTIGSLKSQVGVTTHTPHTHTHTHTTHTHTHKHTHTHTVVYPRECSP